MSNTNGHGPQDKNDGDDIGPEMDKLMAGMLGGLMGLRKLSGLMRAAMADKSEAPPSLDQVDAARPVEPVETEIVIRLPVRIVGTHADETRGLVPDMTRCAFITSAKTHADGIGGGADFQYVVQDDGTVWFCNEKQHVAFNISHVVLHAIHDAGANAQIEIGGVAFESAHAA